MTKLAVLLALLTAGTMAGADQFQTVKVDKSTPRSTFVVSYPQLFSNSVPAYAAINAQLDKHFAENSCGEPEADQAEFYYEASAVVVALNQRYVGMQVSSGDYCGGAHPNYGVYYLTFDAQTGKSLEIGKEFGFGDYSDPNHDWEKEEKLRAKFANLLIDRIPNDDSGECFAGLSREEKLDQLKMFWPTPQGLAKGKTVVVGISPPHVATPCRFDVRLTYSEIKHLLVKGSYLHTWLK